jgi:dolichyl-phosphate beta-glucosyltransferase
MTVIHSIIIPAYNEERRIGKTIEDTYRFFKLKNESFEIIIVDDGSTDNTQTIIKRYQSSMPELKLHSQKQNLGKGAAVRSGFDLAKGEYLLFCDADGSTLISDYDKLFQALNSGADIAIGSREAEGSVVDAYKTRKYIGRIFAMLVNLITGLTIKDTQCGFKLFKKEVAKTLISKQEFNGFSFDVELLYLAKLNQFKISEIGVNWIHASGSKVSVIRDGLKMFRDVLKLRFRKYI